MSSQFKASSKQQVPEGLEVYRDDAPPLSYNQFNNYAPEVVKNQPFEERRNGKWQRVRGFSVLWILVAIAIISFIIGGAIGGGVAAGVRLHNKSSSPFNQAQSPSTSTSSITVTVTTTASTSTTTVINTINDAGCPISINNGSTYTSLTSTNYTIYCNTDISPGTDIQTTAILGTSIYSCLGACTQYNDNATAVQESGTCVGATWAIYDPANLALAGHCYLKALKTLTVMATGAIGLCGLVPS